jgi:hypothetical protein
MDTAEKTENKEIYILVDLFLFTSIEELCSVQLGGDDVEVLVDEIST